MTSREEIDGAAELLKMAIDAGDPQPELQLRIDDLLHLVRLPPVETGELVKRLQSSAWHGYIETRETMKEAASAFTQQEAEIARLQKAFEQERANNLRNAREATVWCDAAEKAEAERDGLRRKLDDAVKALGSEVYERVLAALSQKDETR